MLRDILQPLKDSVDRMSTKKRIWTLIGTLIYAAALGGLINIAVVPFWIKLSAFIIAVIVSIVFCYSFLLLRKRELNQEEEGEYNTHAVQPDVVIPPKPSTPPTNAIEHKSLVEPTGTNISVEITSNKPPRRRFIRRKLFRELINENDVHFLVIHSYTPIPQGKFKRRLWKHRTQKIELDNSPDVDVRLATKIRIFPTDKETKIFCLERLHWWSHGPAQLGVIACAIAVMLPTALIGSSDSNWDVRLAIITVAALGFGVWYYAIWMKWAYTYLIFTNSKIRLLYRPPFNLPSQTPSTDLVKLTGGMKSSSSWLGNNLHYGTIQTETVANVVDDWLLKLVRYVKNYERKAQLLEQLREDAEHEFA